GFVLGYAHGQRNAAQATLINVAHDFSANLSKQWGSIDDQLRAPEPSRTLLDLAQETLTELLQKLHDATETAPERLEDYDRVRSLGKELRYSMEIFADCFRKTLREELYPRVEAMQEILGEVNDSRVAIENLTFLRGRLKSVGPQQWKQVGPDITSQLRLQQRR